jgi:hypothetical protein
LGALRENWERGERMVVETQTGNVNRSNLVLAMKIVAVLYAALVLVQAIIAGRGWFKDFDLIKTHGDIGMGVFVVAIVQVVLAFMVFGPRSSLTLGFVLVLILTGAQLGLGFASDENSTAASLHIPNGVLIFGLTCVLASRVVGSLKTRA